MAAKSIMPILLIGVLTACSPPPEQAYCAGLGVAPENPEHARCVEYFFTQQAAFSSDRSFCALEADDTYPPSLYSRPYSVPVRVHGGGPYGFPRTEFAHVGADYQLNAQIDALRMRIIGPCMQSRGWNSAQSWQAGRHHVSAPAARSKPDRTGPLPWQASP